MNLTLKKPLISEKTIKMAREGLYTFFVDKNARKPKIIKSIEEKFSVDVIAINTVNYKEKIVLQRGNRRKYRMQSGFKKATVRLKKGQKLAIFEEESHKEEPVASKQSVKEKKSLLKGTKVKVEKITENKKGEK